jgi:peptidoglycan hydrolase CwlO-like protein
MNIRRSTTVLLLTIAIFLGIGSAVFTPNVTYAETDQEKAARLTSEIEKYQNEINKLKSQATTLSNQIAQYDAQIRLTELKVNQIEEKIVLLTGRIDQLDASLSSLTTAFENRAVQTYKMSRFSEMYFLLSANDLDSMVASYHYLKRVQEEDRSLVNRLTTAQNTYKEEKTEQEKLQDELESQQKVLGTQKIAKGRLLEQTKNDEKKYQQLLAALKSEYESIQAILAGKGQESEVGKVSQGSRIASVIQGPSCNSNGAHLHFIVSKNGVTQNPFQYLKSGVSYENCSGSSCGSNDGDAFNPSGSWEWPVSPPIDFTQGYGSTWAVRNTYVGRIYSFHNGIDIDSSNAEVKAVRSGTLYRGSYGGVNGCRLRYVRVHHDEGDLDTFYLHINY